MNAWLTQTRQQCHVIRAIYHPHIEHKFTVISKKETKQHNNNENERTCNV